MTEPKSPPGWLHPLPVAELPKNRETEFSLLPDATARQAICTELGIMSLRKLRFYGTLSASGKSDWHLNAKLGATVLQACVVTLAPVSTRIDETVMRHYLGVPPEFEAGSEFEIPADDQSEPLGDSIDPGRIMVEALALALPQFPRSPGAEHVPANFTEPGKTPLSDADARPFAQLKSLRDRAKNDTD